MQSKLEGIEFSISVDNTDFPIVALRPVRPNDRLWLAYTEETLFPVIKYIRAAAFKEDLMSQHIHFDSGDLYHKGIRAKKNDQKHPYTLWPRKLRRERSGTGVLLQWMMQLPF